MSKQVLKFRMLAYSDAAGKYNPDAPLNGNEDNFYVDDNISDDIQGQCQIGKDIVMSDCGCLMVVADGMGGMNAGEVASDIAVNTVKDLFSSGKISPAIAGSATERRKYLEQTIKEADRRIKADAAENPEHEGMGSTIIIAWIVGDKMTLSWCGDSRAYRFNPTNGIELLSLDHSYVQELVNRGELTYEDTFEHPQGNIVTRSLGDPNATARPDTKEFQVYNDDIILLCSDGLSGVLRDRKTKDHNGNYYPGENLEDIIYSNCSSLPECKDALMAAAERADWYDNVTVLLCKIVSGAGTAVKKQPYQQNNGNNASQTKIDKKKTVISVAIGILIGFVLCAAIIFSVNRCIGEGGKGHDDGPEAQTDSTEVQNDSAVIVGRPLPPEDMNRRQDHKPGPRKGGGIIKGQNNPENGGAAGKIELEKASEETAGEETAGEEAAGEEAAEETVTLEVGLTPVTPTDTSKNQSATDVPDGMQEIGEDNN